MAAGYAFSNNTAIANIDTGLLAGLDGFVVYSLAEKEIYILELGAVSGDISPATGPGYWQLLNNGNGDMLKAEYDPTENGYVDLAANLNGISAATDGQFYGKQAGVSGFFAPPGSGSGSGDMEKSTYDTDDDGIVDAAESIDGVAGAADGEFYGKQEGVAGFFPPPGSGSGSGDMEKSTYDTDDNGIVDAAESISGSPGNGRYYGTDGSGTKGFYSLPAGTGDMTKLVYDSNDDGIVDIAAALSGTPGNSKYYGTDVSGTKGYFDLPTGGGGGATPAEAEVYYELSDEQDSSGNGKTLTNNGSVPFVASLNGNGALFTGNPSQGLSVTDSPEVQFGDKDWSIYTVIRFDSSAQDQAFISKYQDGSGSPIEFLLTTATANTLVVAVGDGASGIHISEITNLLTTGSFLHIAVQYDSNASTLTGYLNNAQVFSETPSITPGVGNSDFEIGRWAAGSATCLALIDQVLKFDYLLTPEQLSILYNGGAGQADPLTALAGGSSVGGGGVQLDAVNTFTKAQIVAPVNLVISSGVVTIDASLSNYFTLQLTANVTSVVLNNVAAGTGFDIEVYQDATGGRTLTGWPAGLLWPGGNEPTLDGTANAEEALISIISRDGTVIKGVYTAEVFS